MYADFSSMGNEAAREATQDRRSLNGARKRTKFTPANVRQIVNLVERGKGKEEIANIIGVTTGTLQVTCSKLGISLRPPRFDTGTGILRRRRVDRKNAESSAEASSQSAPVAQGTNVQDQSNVQDQPLAENGRMKEGEVSNGGQESGTESSASVNLAIRMDYKGKERTREIPLAQHMIGRLALEAEFRGIGTGELMVQLITAVIEKDMFEVVLG